jgi:cytochrome c-type biogenesis protein CcsB
MADVGLAETSNTLFVAAFVAYLVAAVGYFFCLAFTRVSVNGAVAGTGAGRRIGLAATGVTLAGVVVHAGSVATRGLAAGRVPWGNMYEYGSLIAFVAVIVGLVVIQRRMGFGHLMGFVLAPAVVMMVSAQLLFTEPAPLQPALQSYWLKIHTSAMGVASGVFMVAFAATVLYLAKDAAERRLASRSDATYAGSTVGAAGVETSLPERPEGYVEDDDAESVAPESATGEAVVASPLAQRRTLSLAAFVAVPTLLVGLFVLAIGGSVPAAGGSAGVAGLLGATTWYAVPSLPHAARLDSLAYRVTAFAFPIWTFGVIAGAIWAEEAWGRYWGWDPKETAAFCTWMFYAIYLHARSTHGWRGKRAAWIHIAAFGVLLATLYVVNLVVSGLHSYAGV